ncbi:hypothetical protein [Streptomyces sp. NPDC006668]|uniref:hypothetical protein n=1 Tax=Streptomyces sp. NPDC006668 TaxID=3156903 RepID=UPI0033BFE8B9
MVPGVVGHHALDAGEELGRAGEEGRAGGALFIGQDLGGPAGAVVDGRVHAFVADAAAADVLAAVVGPLAVAIEDPSELLDVHVDQAAGLVLLAACGAVCTGRTTRPVSGSRPPGVAWVAAQIRLTVQAKTWVASAMCSGPGAGPAGLKNGVVQSPPSLSLEAVYPAMSMP